ncbi:MAG: RluA family pseudouridine synthase [Thermodesulfobacteriota bacterium]
MAEALRVRVNEAAAGERVDRFLSQETGLTRSRVQRLIDEGRITHEGKPVRANHKTRPGEEFFLVPPDPDTGELLPANIPVRIVHEDDHILLVDKPPNLVVYPAAGHASGTLMNRLAYHVSPLAEVGGPLRPGVVHRLDKDTSGVMVFAKTDEAYYGLQRQFRDRTIKRRYLALVYGRLNKEAGSIDKPLGRSEHDRKKISTRVRRGKEAVTLWTCLEHFSASSLVEVRLLTGRTHQIRVHFASIGHPVLGDRTYGRKLVLGSVRFSRQMLHAACLGVEHPVTGQWVEYCVPLPEDMQDALEDLRRSASL